MLRERVITRDMIVAETLDWLGTPKVWGQSKKGRGCDCLGLAIGVARALHMPEGDFPRTMVQNYKTADSGRLIAGFAEILRPSAALLPGDLLLLPAGFADPAPRHVAIIVSASEIVHCYGRQIGRVVKVPMGRNRRIHSSWTWPSLRGN